MNSRKITLILLLLCFFAGTVFAEEEAEDLNPRGEWTFAGGRIVSYGDGVNDKDPESKHLLPRGKTLRILFPEGTEPAKLCVQWYEKPGDALIERYGADGTLLGSDTVNGRIFSVTALEPGTCEIVIRPTRKAITISEVCVFGPGVLPEPYREFLPMPEKLDYLIIAAHPDDDVLFLGGAVPYLAGEEGLKGTIVYVTAPGLRVRYGEALAGARTMGIEYEPVFGDMADVYADTLEKLEKKADTEAAVLFLVRLIRQYRPTVIFTHGPEGEYGHTEHKFVSAAVLEAIEKAQDPFYDTWSLEDYELWQVQKLYWHDYEQAEATLLFEPDEPLASFGGKTAYEICCEAFEKHASQFGRTYSVHRYGEHHDSFNFFGLAYSAVGEEGELRAGIDPALFSDFTPSPSPEPAAAPSPEPSPGPAATPAPSSSAPEQTEAPAKTPIPSSDEEKAEDPFLDKYAKAAIAALLLLGVFFARLWLKKWRES